MSSIKFSTVDGKKIIVCYGEKTFEYSVDDLSIDASKLIKEIAESENTEEINIACEEVDDYLEKNSVDEEFKELYIFLKTIPEKYNDAIKEVTTLEE